MTFTTAKRNSHPIFFSLSLSLNYTYYIPPHCFIYVRNDNHVDNGVMNAGGQKFYIPFI